MDDRLAQAWPHGVGWAAGGAIKEAARGNDARAMKLLEQYEEDMLMRRLLESIEEFEQPSGPKREGQR